MRTSRVERVETVRVEEFPNLLFVRITDSDGCWGLGETYYGARAVEAHIHETVAPYLLGEDPGDITRHHEQLRGYLGTNSTGVETRADSATDIALWDLQARALGVPLYRLLGGAVRPDIPVYNTCAGPNYARGRLDPVRNWGVVDGGELEDLQAFLHRPADLAESLLDEGITAMKIWPFDELATRTGGMHLPQADLGGVLDTFEAIRAKVGDRMEVLVEFHSLWSLPVATAICRALEPYRPYWVEDPVRSDDPAVVRRLVESTSVPVAVSETLAGASTFRRLLEAGAADVVLLDVGWSGGVTEALRIAQLARLHQLPVSLHDCTGPLSLALAVQLAVHLPNAGIQEVVRAFYRGWYADLVDGLPLLAEGRIRPSEGVGLGLTLRPEVFERADCRVTASTRS